MSSPPETSTAEMDRISSLPDDILIHILSSLPTKQAFLTSILSKRWKHLWCFVPDINFTETEDSDLHLFYKFVDSILCTRKGAGNHSIHSFILDVEYKRYKRGRITRKLSNTILTCTTLVVLKLSYLYMGLEFCYYPIILPSLKTLYLKDIKFDQYGDLKRLLEYCPVLEDLQLYVIIFSTRQNSKAPYETLTKLNRADIIDCDCGVLMKALSNLEFLHIEPFRVYLPKDFPTFNNLTHLVINYHYRIDLQLLHHCPKLQTLDLYQKIQGRIWGNKYDYVPILDRSFHNWTLPKSVPSCLSLSLTTCTMRDFGFGDLQHKHIMLARYILNNSAVLEIMSIWSKLKLSKIKRQLFSCSRASATSKLSIYSEHI